MDHTTTLPLVVKVGGSLYDLPDLGSRLRAWLASQTGEVILVPGGGALVDTIRRLDQLHHLGEEACHWLALRMLTINAHFLAQLLEGTCIIDDPDQRISGRCCIMDMHAFALADEKCPGRLPHTWSATSDSFAVRVAIVAGAKRLVLLKSTSLKSEMSWPDAVLHGYVDGHFCEALSQVPADLSVRMANLREWASPLTAHRPPP